MFEKRVLRGLMMAIALALLVALLPSLALADKGDPPSGPGTRAVGHTTISGNPLTIHVAADTSIQVLHAAQPNGQVYPAAYSEADSGGFAWLNRMVFGPDFANHAESAANTVNPWLPAGPQTTMGTGTTADPWWVGTTVWGPPPISVQQWVRYVDGEDCFRVSYIINDGEIGEPLPVTFFHAADLHVAADDDGYGYYASGGVGAWSLDRTFLEYMVPVTEMGLPPASHYQESVYQAIWNRIGDVTGPGAGFNDTVIAVDHDSGCGLQWDLVLPGVQPPGNFVELALDWCFVLEEEPPPPEFVPEPGSVLLLASGLMGLAGYAGLRARKR